MTSEHGFKPIAPRRYAKEGFSLDIVFKIDECQEVIYGWQMFIGLGVSNSLSASPCEWKPKLCLLKLIWWQAER
jgi:hypothetical protein